MSLDDILMKSDDLLQKEMLDAGGFGLVSLCFHKSQGLVVLKTVYTGPQRTDCNTSLLEEGKIMQKLNHERVVKLLGIILENGNYSLVMEYVRRGNLMSVLKATNVPLSMKGQFILEIIEGMVYLTEQGLVHKDLKPKNILVDEDFHIKIADLGVACFKNWSKLTKEETSRQRKIKCSSKSNAGTLLYMAPEHFQNINTVPVEKSDVYSFGIVLWSIFANKEPYENALNDAQLCFCVISGGRPNTKEIEESCPIEIIALMQVAWRQEPQKRPTFAEISLAYKPFYQLKFEKYIDSDMKRLKEVYPEHHELVKRMESLQVDAVAEPPTSGRTDLSSSLHSSHASGTVDECFFETCPENEPVESYEISFERTTPVEHKLHEELNYHNYGSRMDKAESRRMAYSAAAHEEERRRKVSHDPFSKVDAVPHPQVSRVRPRVSAPVVNPSGPDAALHGYPRKPTLPARSPETTNISQYPAGFCGVASANPKTSPSPEDLYQAHSTSPFYSKPPVPESSVDHLPKSLNPNRSQYQSSLSAEQVESAPFTKKNVGNNHLHRHSTGYTIFNSTVFNSSGIQIGSNNYFEIGDHPDQPNIPPANTHYICEAYQKLFDSTAQVSDKHLDIVTECLRKKWKQCGRRLGFHDPDLDEIDYDYEREGIHEKVHKMLQKWVMREGSKGATVGKLALALKACQKIDILNRFVEISQESK